MADEDEDETENLLPRREPERAAPLIARAPVDAFIKIALTAVVALLTFLLLFAYNGNREIGEMRSEWRENTKATDRRIDALETATDRRLTAIENRVERIWEDER